MAPSTRLMTGALAPPPQAAPKRRDWPRYHHHSTPLPANLTDADICKHYPNHLRDAVLQGMYSRGFLPCQIYENMPDDTKTANDRAKDMKSIHSDTYRAIGGNLGLRGITETTTTIAPADYVVGTLQHLRTGSRPPAPVPAPPPTTGTGTKPPYEYPPLDDGQDHHNTNYVANYGVNYGQQQQQQQQPAAYGGEYESAEAEIAALGARVERYEAVFGPLPEEKYRVNFGQQQQEQQPPAAFSGGYESVEEEIAALRARVERNEAVFAPLPEEKGEVDEGSIDPRLL